MTTHHDFGDPPRVGATDRLLELIASNAGLIVSSLLEHADRLEADASRSFSEAGLDEGTRNAELVRARAAELDREIRFALGRDSGFARRSLDSRFARYLDLLPESAPDEAVDSAMRVYAGQLRRLALGGQL